MDDESAFQAGIHSVPRCEHCSSIVKKDGAHYVQGNLLCSNCYGRTVVVDGRVGTDEQADSYFVRLVKEGRNDAAAEFLRKVKAYREQRAVTIREELHTPPPVLTRCGKCGQSFEERYLVQTATGQSLCSKCEAQSRVSEQRQNRSSQEQLNVNCANCGQSFSRGDVVESSPGRYLCRLCGPAGRVTLAPSPPVLIDQELKPTQCDYCKSKFRAEDLVESDAGRFLCRTCGPGLHRRRAKEIAYRNDQLRLNAIAEAQRKRLEDSYEQATLQNAQEQERLRIHIAELKAEITKAEQQNREGATASSENIGVSRQRKIDEATLRTISHEQFEEWAVKAVGVFVGGTGIPNDKKTADMGLDGRVLIGKGLLGERLWHAVQVKQFEISRPEIDKFNTAMQRADRMVGYFVAFGFSHGAQEEIKRFKEQTGREIFPVTVAQLLASPEVKSFSFESVELNQRDSAAEKTHTSQENQSGLVSCDYCRRTIPRRECVVGTGYFDGRVMCPACAGQVRR